VCDKDNAKNLISINSICTTLEFSGSGIIEFLNNLLISDLSTIDKGKYHYTAVCNPKGRIIASLWIKIISEEKIYLICPKNMDEQLITFFNMRKFRLKITIQLSDKAVTINSEDHSITHLNINIESQKQNVLTETQSFYQLLFAQELPWIDANNSEKFIPQHVNLDQHDTIMSFTKGCYPGQEIIARLKYLGKIKKRMQLFKNKNKDSLLNDVKEFALVSPVIYLDSNNTYYIQAITHKR